VEVSTEEAMMDDLEKARAQAEARQAEERRMTSADRARFWAGLNRYLGAEAVREHHASERDEDPSSSRSSSDTQPGQ
jgi:hypothetical protein